MAIRSQGTRLLVSVPTGVAVADLVNLSCLSVMPLPNGQGTEGLAAIGNGETRDSWRRPMRDTLILTVGLALVPLRAQTTPEPDANRAALAIQYIDANSANGNFVVNTVIEWAPGHYEVRANLILEAGGKLSIKNSHVEVNGNVEFRANGNLEILDSTFGLKNTTPTQYNYWWYGGRLRTERVTIGGAKVNGLGQTAAFWLNNGFWDAYQTTVQFSGGILLGWTRQGYRGQPDQKGGTLRADGLYQGEAPDALHMSGWGDAFVQNSNFAMSLYVYADPSAPFRSTLDLSSRVPIQHEVFGDPMVHAGVTRPLPGSPSRVEFRNVRVPLWYLFAQESTMTAPPVEITMLNAESVILNFHGRDITGSPVLRGPWSQHYSRLPGLPATRNPCFHPIPPDCSVQIGNVTFKAGPSASDWVHIHGWGLYLRGRATNFTVNGAMQNIETWIEDGSMSFIGDGNYDAGVHANRIELHGTARLLIRNGAIGEFGVGHVIQGVIKAYGLSTCTIEDCRISDLQLVTLRETEPNSSYGVDGATVTAQNVWVDGLGRLTQSQSAGGSIRVIDAARNQSWDRQNLDFEEAVAQPLACPDYWECQFKVATSNPDVRPLTTGLRSVEIRNLAQAATLWKRLALSEETRVQLLGWAKVLSAVSPGAQVELAVGAPGGNLQRRPVPVTVGDPWQLIQVPIHTVGAGETATDVLLGMSAIAATVHADDFRVQIANWWDNDNLANLAFEEPAYREVGRSPRFWKAPDFWKVWQAQCSRESVDRRPGAAPNSTSVRVVAQDTQSLLFKDLTFLAPGDRLTISGYIKGIPTVPNALYLKIQIGQGDRFWDTGNGCGNRRVDLIANGSWQQFNEVYVVPSGACHQAYTRFNIEAFGVPGNVFLLDDITINISR